MKSQAKGALCHWLMKYGQVSTSDPFSCDWENIEILKIPMTLEFYSMILENYSYNMFFLLLCMSSNFQ